MELIIDIPEDLYTRLFDNGIQDNEIEVDDVCEMARALRLGRPIEQEPTGWIPCSERLPENKTYVLTTIRIPGRQPHTRSGWYEDGLFMNDNGDTWKSSDIEVTAWLPLPEPFKEG